MKAGKKIVSSVVCLSVLASLGGCSMFDKDDEGVLAAVEDYAEAVKKGRVGNIVDLLVDGDDYEDELDEYMEGGDALLLPDGYDDICEAILDTLEYEIDEDTVESSKKNQEGSVSITWTLVDYDSVFDEVFEENGDVDAYIDALEECEDRIEISQRLDLVLDEDTWLIDDDRLKNLEDVYEFYEDALDYIFIAPLSDYIAYTEWYYSDNGLYINYDQIELDIVPTDDGYEVEWEFYYEYYLNGELIYTSDECWDSGYWIEAYYGPNYDENCRLTDNGTLIDGEYRCVIYDLGGRVLADSTCTVQNLDVQTSAEYIDDIEWYYSDDDIYINYNQIELDIIPTDGLGTSMIWNFYYEYYRDGELIYTSPECTDQGYWIEAYYGPYYDDEAELNESGYLIDGDYTCIFYDLDGNVLCESTCTVITGDFSVSTDLVDYTEWYYSNNDVYVNYSQIELDIIPTSGIGESITWDFYYEYYIDGDLVFTSDECSDMGHWIEAYYGPDYDPNCQLTAQGNLIPGQYRCIIYDLDDNVLADSTCTVR